MSARRWRALLALTLAMATGGSFHSAYASGRAADPGYRATVSGPASGIFVVHVATTYSLTTARPSARAHFSAFEVASASGNAYLFYAYVDHTGRVFFAEERRTPNGQEGSGGDGGWIGVGGSEPPATVEVSTLQLAPGRYRFTVLTRERTGVSLSPFGRVQRHTTLHLTPEPAATAVVASYEGQNVAQNTYRNLPLRIYNHAHAAFVVVDQNWSGNSSVQDVGACFGQDSDQTQCLANGVAIDAQICVESLMGFCAVEPTTDTGTQGRTDFIGVDQPAAGNGVGVYSVISGSITRQSIVAVALP